MDKTRCVMYPLRRYPSIRNTKTGAHRVVDTSTHTPCPNPREYHSIDSTSIVTSHNVRSQRDDEGRCEWRHSPGNVERIKCVNRPSDCVAGQTELSALRFSDAPRTCH